MAISEKTIVKNILVLVYSSQNLENIVEFVNQFGDKNSVSNYRVDYSSIIENDEKIYKPTDRTILTIPEYIYDRIVKCGYDVKTEYDFKIVKYEIRKHNYPYPDCEFSFYIPFPQEIDSNDKRSRKWMINHFNNKMNNMVDIGIIPKNTFEIFVPFNGKSYAKNILITFRDIKKISSYNPETKGYEQDLSLINYQHIAIIKIKIILDMTIFFGPPDKDGSSKEYYVHISWNRNRKNKSKEKV